MTKTTWLTDLRKPPSSPITADHREWQRAIHRYESQAAANPRSRQFDRVTTACALGGAALGTAGGVLGAGMPYHHPVAMALSVIWWGIYFGCFGLSMGALIAFFSERTLASPSERPDGADTPPSTEGHWLVSAPAIAAGDSPSQLPSTPRPNLCCPPWPRPD